MQRKPRILLYDLEVSPALGFFYPPLYQTNILTVEKYQKLMSASWAFFDEDNIKIKHVKLDDFPARFKADRWDDTDVVKKLYSVMQEADIVIAHNGVNFDNKMANTFFLKNGLPALPEYKTVDTLKTARQKLRLASNKLDEMAKELGIEGKTKITIGALWYDYMMGDGKDVKKTGKLLKKYNDQDVWVLWQIYLRLRPLMKNHPNISVMGDIEGCPKCGSHERQYRGYYYTSTVVYRKILCLKCGGWYRERMADKDIQNKPEYVN